MTNPTKVADAVRVTIEVEAPIARAFAVFTEGCDTWWPRGHHLSPSGLDAVVLEEGEGGRWFERGVDGSECDWGRVLVWEPPHRLVLSWQLDPDWNAGVPDERASRVDVRFAALDEGRTRVDLVHEGLANHGDGWERIRDGVAGQEGWSGILANFGRVVT